MDADPAVAAAEKAARHESKGKGRKLTARCWMAQDFPMSLQQLLPVLDVISHANKHVAKVRVIVVRREINNSVVTWSIPL